MTKEQQLEKERELLVILEGETQKMLVRLKNNGQHSTIDFQRAKEVIGRIFHNELDYLHRDADDYYELYIEYYYKN